MHLSYSEMHGQYIKEDFFKLIQTNPTGMPQLKLNERNAIMLNCKDRKKFQEVYEKTIVKHFKDMPDPYPAAAEIAVDLKPIQEEVEERKEKPKLKQVP